MSGPNFFALCLLIVVMTQSVNCWSWQCNNANGYCTRSTENNINTTYSSENLCQLICGSKSYLNIWPYPTVYASSSKKLVNINPSNINFQTTGPSSTQPFLNDVIEYFKEQLGNSDKMSYREPAYTMNITLEVTSAELSLTLDTNEEYTLETWYGTTANVFRVSISGNTVFGVRHGIETMLQLLVIDEENGLKYLTSLSDVKISDKPTYPHRGLLIDSARNYLSVGTIKKNIDAMAASKLNVLHWHITDSQSFPLVSPTLPNMAKYGAYNKEQIYTPEVISDLVQYAKIRGVRILMEIDGPSHAGSGWEWGEEEGLGNLTVCVNKQPWRSFCIQPPCGQMNPANPNLYRILNYLFKDISEMCPNSGMFHMGGDEVFLPCWNTTEEIVNYIKDKPRTEATFLDLWGEYQGKALEAYDSAVGHNRTSVVLWTSGLTDPSVIQKYLPKERYIIQTWVKDSSSDLITSLLELDYKLIISTKDKWYLDHGFWGTTLYYSWREVYDNKMYTYRHKNILGGEVCMWGELVDDSNIESRVWPRAAAAAERLWSNPTSTSRNADSRFFAQRDRLVSRGIKASSEIPKWCVQNEGECLSYVL